MGVEKTATVPDPGNSAGNALTLVEDAASGTLMKKYFLYKNQVIVIYETVITCINITVKII